MASRTRSGNALSTTRLIEGKPGSARGDWRTIPPKAICHPAINYLGNSEFEKDRMASPTGGVVFDSNV